MWKTLGRIVVVTLFWAGVSISASAAGVASASADLLAGVGAGLSLIIWGVLLHRTAPHAEQAPAAMPTVLPGRERATV